MVSRPFEKVDQLRRTAEQRYRDSQAELLLKLDAVQNRLNAIEQQAASPNGNQTAALAALTAEKIGLRKALRRIQHDLNRDVERLGHWLKAINIIGMPLLLLIAAGFLTLRRRQRRDFSRVNYGSL